MAANSSPSQTETGAAHSEQATKKKRGSRGGRRRGKGAKALAGIQVAARIRQRAWTEGGHPNISQPMTTDLNGRDHVYSPEGLFADRRYERSGEIPPGPPTSGPAPDERPGPHGGMAR